MLGVSLAFLAVIADAQTRVSDVAVTVVVGGPVSGGRQVILSAVPLDPLPNDTRGPVELTFELLSRPSLRLGHGRWHLSATADGLWFAPTEMDVVEPATVVLRAWPMTQTRGVFDRRLTRQQPLPTQLEASVEIDGLGEPGSFIATEPCSVSAADWECNVPATKLTIRLQADGYAPRYLRDVEPSQKGYVASPLVLERGGSVVGVVLDGQTQRPDPSATVDVLTASGDPIGRRPSSSVDRSGYFQVVLPGPGSYVLRATTSGRTAASEPIEVGSRDDIRLSEPLVLRPPLTLRLAASPPLDPLGHRWRVALYTVQGVEAGLLAQGAADRDGTWSREGLAEGAYAVRFSTEAGALWAGKRFDLSPETDIVEVDVSACLLTGKVTAGGRPLHGRVVFGGERGPLSIALESNEDGVFEGDVPCREDLTSRSWKVLVESGGVRRLAQGVRLVDSAGAFHADITFTNSTIELELVDEVGNPVEGATVTVTDAKHPERRDQVGEAELETEHRSRGKLWLHGLDDGSYLIEARAGRMTTSEPTPLEIGSDTRRQSLRLVLRSELEVPGRVVAEDGSPIPLATVRLVPTQSVFPFAKEIQTKADGTFTVRLPAGTREVSLLARSYGRSLRLSRMALGGPSEPLVVRLASTGGTLVLNHAHPLVADAGTYVLRDGAFVDTMTLTSWAATHGQPQADGALVVPQMDEGYYHACRVPTAEAQALFSGRLPPRCVGGHLAPGGSLSLDVPSLK